MSTLYLVELDTAVRLDHWVLDAPGVYRRTMTADILHVTDVEEDAVSLTAQTSSAAVAANPGSWYYDVVAKTLWVSTTGAAAIATKTVAAVILEPLARERSVVKARAGVDVAWDGRVRALPEVGLALGEDEFAAVTTLGTLVVDNRDGRYDGLLGTRTLQGREVRVYRGDEADAYADFALWLKALADEPTAGREVLTVPLFSLARALDAPMITTSFALADYPAMDANITGFNIPRVYGTVVGAESFRIASGRWKVAGHAMTSITAAAKADGTTVAITGTDLALGEFTVDAAHDGEARLYADGRGIALDAPGELIRRIAEDAGVATADIDTTALAAVDAARAVDVGVQVLAGSVRDQLDRVARSAFVDVMVTRANLLSARLRTRDEGNLVINATFETDAAGWSADGGGSVARTTAYHFRGAAALQITKPVGAGNSLARAVYDSLTITAGLRYSLTMLAALAAGTTTAFRLGLLMEDGTEYLADPVTLSAAAWTRVTLTTPGPVDPPVVYCDSTAVTCDSTAVYCSSGSRLVAVLVYPEHGGAAAVTAVIDDVDFVDSFLVDDTNAVLEDLSVRGPVLWLAKARYRVDGRTGFGRYASSESAATRRLYPTAESRQIDGWLVAAADASTVAAAALTYYGAARLRVTYTVLGVDTQVAVGDTLDVRASRAPTLPGTGRLFRVVEVSESHVPGAVPRLRVVGEAQYDPIGDQEVIVAA